LSAQDTPEPQCPNWDRRAYIENVIAVNETLAGYRRAYNEFFVPDRGAQAYVFNQSQPVPEVVATPTITQSRNVRLVLLYPQCDLFVPGFGVSDDGTPLNMGVLDGDLWVEGSISGARYRTGWTYVRYSQIHNYDPSMDEPAPDATE
jgi:hypothetical protein